MISPLFSRRPERTSYYTQRVDGNFAEPPNSEGFGVVADGWLDNPCPDPGHPSPNFVKPLSKVCSMIFHWTWTHGQSMDKLWNCPQKYTVYKPLSKVCPIKYFGQAHDSLLQPIGRME